MADAVDTLPGVVDVILEVLLDEVSLSSNVCGLILSKTSCGKGWLNSTTFMQCLLNVSAWTAANCSELVPFKIQQIHTYQMEMYLSNMF